MVKDDELQYGKTAAVSIGKQSDKILFIAETSRFYNQTHVSIASNKKINVLKLCRQPFFYIFYAVSLLSFLSLSIHTNAHKKWCDYCVWSLCKFVSANPRSAEIIRIRLWCHIKNGVMCRYLTQVTHQRYCCYCFFPHLLLHTVAIARNFWSDKRRWMARYPNIHQFFPHNFRPANSPFSIFFAIYLSIPFLTHLTHSQSHCIKSIYSFWVI